VGKVGKERGRLVRKDEGWIGKGKVGNEN